MKNAVFFLMCFLYFPNGVLFGADWGKRNKVTLKIGENVTLQFPVNDSAAGEITRVIWTKGSNTFLKISKDKRIFLNKTYESIICSSNISSITICHATRSDTGLYTAQITYSDESNKRTVKLTYYVAEHLYFCDGTTYRNKIEGDTVNLHVKKDPTEHSWWGKNNINVTDSENPKLSVNDIGTLSIPNVRKEDEGNYTVTIVKENSHPYPLCNHTYILSISPSSFCGKTTNCNKTEGDTVTLTGKVCKSAESCRWSKNNTNVTASENPKVSIYDNGTLSIHNVTKEDDGNYTVINERIQCSYTYILSISSAEDGTSSPSSDLQILSIVFGVVAPFMAIALTVFCIYKCKTEKCCRTLCNPDPPREEHTHQEEIPLNSSSHPNGVCKNEEETGCIDLHSDHVIYCPSRTHERASTSCGPSAAKPDN